MRYPRMLVPMYLPLHVRFSNFLLFLLPILILIRQKYIIHPSYTPEFPRRQPLALPHWPRSSFRDATAPCGARRGMPSVQWIDEFVVLSILSFCVRIDIGIGICSAIELCVVKRPILRDRADRVRVRIGEDAGEAGTGRGFVGFGCRARRNWAR